MNEMNETFNERYINNSQGDRSETNSLEHEYFCSLFVSFSRLNTCLKLRE